jgi:NAD(P)H-hydrate epimerase
MENASRAVADEACEMLGGGCVGGILILCGGGNNGGDGLAAARHLHNRGAQVTIALATDPASYKGDALINWRIVQAMGLPVASAQPPLIERPGALLIIDAIFGTGLDRQPRDPFPPIANAVERTGLPVLAVDVPSGLDCDTGKPLGACIRATRTVTFVAEKAGFSQPEARHWLGGVVVGDIGCPAELIEEVATRSGQSHVAPRKPF